jgi:hypothetical protein
MLLAPCHKALKSQSSELDIAAVVAALLRKLDTPVMEATEDDAIRIG